MDVVLVARHFIELVDDLVALILAVSAHDYQL
jgi:hypothetical protein